MLSIKTEDVAKINKIIADFIWNSKPPKVKRSTMIAEYEYGGLKYPNIEAMLTAQKIMWIKRYFFSSHHPWKLIFEWQLEKVGGQIFFKFSNLNLDFIKMIKTRMGLTDFYADVFSAWAEYNRTAVITPENVLDQNLFYNHNFNNPIGMSLGYLRCRAKGLITVRDVTKENRLKTFEEIKLEKNLTQADIILYMGIQKMIPRYVIGLIDHGKDPVDRTVEQLATKNYKTVYRKLNTKLIEKPTSETKFLIDFNLQPADFENIYKLPFLVTIDSKSRAFQFKINHNIYYTSEKLHKIGIKDSSNCIFCGAPNETLRHFFIECTYVKIIWNDLQRRINFKLTDSDKLFGVYQKVDDSTFDIISHLTIIIKQCINNCRTTKSKPSLAQINSKIREIENIEYRIALKNRKLEKHQTKWLQIKELYEIY